MRVAVYYNNQDIRLQDLPIPKIGKGEILVKILASGICGTDLMEWYRIKKAPRILGHEAAGEIVQSNSKKFKTGQRVFVSHHVPCNKCKYCLSNNHTACSVLHEGNYYPGGYSEFVRVPKINVDTGTYILPKSVSFEEGTMIEPLACVVRGQRIIDVKKGQTVLVLGCGVSGLLNIELAKFKGAKVVAVDINEFRLNRAKISGADKVLHANQNIDIKADKIIICTGAIRAVEQTFKCIDKKGVILLFAIPNVDIKIPTVDFWRNEITLISSYGAAPVDLEESLKLIKNKKINVKEMITHILPLEDIQKGFKIASDAKKSLKIVLKP
ncbi:MAG: alcohol dehydrogenase catalytic domain-containing protein [bacterium]